VTTADEVVPRQLARQARPRPRSHWAMCTNSVVRLPRPALHPAKTRIARTQRVATSRPTLREPAPADGFRGLARPDLVHPDAQRQPSPIARRSRPCTAILWRVPNETMTSETGSIRPIPRATRPAVTTSRTCCGPQYFTSDGASPSLQLLEAATGAMLVRTAA